MVDVQRKDGESSNSLIYRFTKRVQQSGVLREAKKRRYTKRPVNRNKIRLAALHREARKKEIEYARKMGIPSQ
ncbi:MAG: 30S ribosomal protein S21 [Candidatus Harrisonbacteria bacterium CG10_big_fil_rev_8_21_14_0_10_42_17]|uniref:30S ribosomal protein S21 n=1 Tax=Candidatus Harrisonbacteria bacterium CG10_big_fil_rev_8_21_14_0_10_42_17 TaxID=1974584 RepID=A0A2M6WIL8_9BACT|nr:MAG: 30S ribosomal protein S21 [Candidatus Harrisonbacteria bacterium CG10_big_fil_rev_8_21_14_0_10_42_17]